MSFYVTAKELETVAKCTSISRALLFKNQLTKLGYTATVEQKENSNVATSRRTN